MYVCRWWCHKQPSRFAAAISTAQSKIRSKFRQMLCLTFSLTCIHTTYMYAGITWSTREVRGHTVYRDDITTEEALQVHPHEGYQLSPLYNVSTNVFHPAVGWCLMAVTWGGHIHTVLGLYGIAKHAYFGIFVNQYLGITKYWYHNISTYRYNKSIQINKIYVT